MIATYRLERFGSPEVIRNIIKIQYRYSGP